jgi:integrase
MAESNRLNAALISRLSKPGRYGDGGGLYLRVAQYETRDGMAQSKNWVFRFERAGRERQMGLGPLHTLSLADARSRARACRRVLLDGGDPINARQAVRDAERAAAARTMSFKACAETYIAAHRSGWKNPKHAAQWPATMQSYVYPIIGQLSVADIDTALVLKCIEPIWTEIPDTARRVRGRIEKVLDWAKVKGARIGDNPARFNGHLKLMLPKQLRKPERVRHHPALPYADLPEFAAELRAKPEISAKALEFTILTAARTTEVIEAQWSEIDLKAKLWTIPAERMKGARQHVVPLSDRAVAILKAVPRVAGSPHIFPGARDGKPLSNMAMLELLRGMRPGFTVHGFRSTFRDWAGDRTNYPRDLIETALAHAIEDETEAAYRRSTAIEKRRRLMADWAKFCGLLPVTTSKVFAIRGIRT